MKPLIRLVVLIVLVVSGVGLARGVAGMPELNLSVPDISLPTIGDPIDDRPRATFNRGQRVTFDEPSSWHFPPGTVTEVWWCTGQVQVIEGPADLDNICAMAMYD